MRRNNHLVIDLGKAAFAWSYWRNQHGEVQRLKPKGPTAHGVPFNPDEMVTLCVHTGDTQGQELPPPNVKLIELANARGVLDHWIFCVRFRMTCAEVLEFTGYKAISLWKAWNEKQYKKK